MLKLTLCDTLQKKKRYLNFYKKIYKNNPLCRDSMSPVLKDILLGSAEILKTTEFSSFILERSGRITQVFSLALVDRMPDMLQICFFESDRYDQGAFDLLMETALQYAHMYGAGQISGGLNIHVNYGLGFLASDYDKEQSFGLPHNPAFYHQYFLNHLFQMIPMSSYSNPLADFEIPVDPRIMNRISKRYTVRKADFSKIKREAHIYTDINNAAFHSHLFYYNRNPAEDLELFHSFKPLLAEENLLFAYKGNEPVGFMLWYPDFHELMAPAETIGLITVVKRKLLKRPIHKMKLVEMGVLPAEQGHGAILALFKACSTYIQNQYDFCESGWILDENIRSRNFGIKWGDGSHKKFCAYLLSLGDTSI